MSFSIPMYIIIFKLKYLFMLKSNFLYFLILLRQSLKLVNKSIQFGDNSNVEDWLDENAVVKSDGWMLIDFFIFPFEVSTASI